MMTDIKHTPGPWRSTAANGVVDDSGVFVIAKVERLENGVTDGNECIANMHLIAAAPSMAYELLNLIRKHKGGFYPSQQDWILAEQALIDAGLGAKIAKMKGGA